MNLIELPVGDVHPSESNLRRAQSGIQELSQSILAMGVLEPLIVQPNGKGYKLVAGHRRLEAAKKAKLKTVPCVVMDIDDKAGVQVMLIENLQREDLNPLEEGEGYRRLVEEFKYSQRDLAAIVGMSQAHISKRIALTKLPPKAMEAVLKGEVTVTDATLLTGIHPDDVEAVLHRPSWQGLEHAVRQVKQERLIDEAVDKASVEAGPKGWVVARFDDGDGVHIIGDKGYRLWAMNLDPKAHAKLKCHALYVTRDAEILPACADERQHVEKTQETKRAAADREKEAKRIAALKEQKKIRRDFLVHKVATRVPAQARSNMMLAGLMTSAGSESKKVACQLLGLEVDKDDYNGTTTALWKAAESNQDRVSMALAMAAGEQTINHQWGGTEYTQAYLAALNELGYTTSEVEQGLLKKK